MLFLLKRTPSAAIIDSQTSKTVSVSESTSYDGAKKTKGTMRHISVDVLGPLLAVVVHTAGIDERSRARLLMHRVGQWFPALLKVWADGVFTASALQNWFLCVFQYVFEIVKRPRKKFQIVKLR